MKSFFILLIGVIIGTVAGLLTRPSFFLVGQLDWMNVLSKGYFVGAIEGFFTQGMIDESFFHVLKFQGAGIGVGLFLLIIMAFMGGKSKNKSSKKK